MFDLRIRVPIIQAPMAGVSTPALAAAVSNAGGLGSLGVGAAVASSARTMIEEFRSQSVGPLNVNLFVHQPPTVDEAGERRWIEALRPVFNQFGAEPPDQLRTIYTSFVDDDAMLTMLLDARPEVVSFHFGLPSRERIAALKARGCQLISTATSLDEALAARAAGMDAVVAQGIEAGGHRGMFDPSAPDDRLTMMVLTQLLVAKADLPVIAAGGIMDGKGIAAALGLGAVAAQLGTAFVLCEESAADAAYRAAMSSEAAYHTVLTDVISGRPARCLANKFTQWAHSASVAPPSYPRAYDLGKALNAAAKAAGDGRYGAQWAGQGAPLARSLPAADLVSALVVEMNRTV